MRFNKEKCKIYNIGISIISILIILLFFSYVEKIKKERKNQYLEKQEIQLKNFSEFYIEDYKNNIESVFEYFYNRIEVDKLEDSNYRVNLIEDWVEYREKSNYIKWMYIAYDKDTMIIDNSWKKPNNYDLETISWYKKGILGDGILWSEPYEDVVTKKVFLAITKKLKDSKGETKGLFVIDIDLEGLSEAVSKFDINQENFIYDENYKVVAHTNHGLLNKNIKDLPIIKKIELSKKNYVYDEKSNAYIYYKNNLGWTTVKKVPQSVLIEAENRINKWNYLYFFVFLIMAITLHILYILRRKSEKLLYFKALRAVQNRESIVELLRKNKEKESLLEEIYNIQKIIENLEKETYKDQETGLYAENYLNYYINDFIKEGKKILLISYENLLEIKNQHGKNVVELVLKRGAMTLNALKEREEIALRIDKNTIALVLNPNEIEEKSNYIISEILNYKWRLYNIYLKLSWKILTIEEYQKECEKEKIF